ncbi:MAG: two-component regulator propeller domain-containing protein [Chloroflexota bacterium]
MTRERRFFRGHSLFTWGGIRQFKLVMLTIGLAVVANAPAMAQEGTWSNPTMLSTNTRSSWFPDIAVDDWGQPYVVWNSGRPTKDRGQMDLLMYSTLSDDGWMEPSDIAVAAFGGYTVRPAITVDSSRVLHVTFRGETVVYYTSTPAASASKASSWVPRRLSGAGTAYYSDIAVDDQGGIHVVWNESMSLDTEERWFWFGTPAGIAIYDGRNWLTGEPVSGLSNHSIQAMIEGHTGLQWIATQGSLLQFDGYALKSLGFLAQSVTCVVQDADGDLWLGTDIGAMRYRQDAQDGASWALYAAREGLPEGAVNAVAIDLQGNVWVGTTTGLASFDGQSWTKHYPLADTPTSEVLAIAVDAQENVWVGTRHGAMQYDGKNWQTFTAADGLAGDTVTVIAAAREDQVWFGTDQGLSWFDGQAFTSFADEPALSGQPITALLVDSQGTVWAGTPGGASRYDGQTWEPFELPPNLVGQPITAISEDRRVNAMCPSCSDIFYSHSTDGGMAWSAPVNLSNSFAGSVKPQVRPGNDGHVYVTWEEGEDWYIHEGYPVGSMFVHSADGGKTWTSQTSFTTSQGTPQQITLGTGRNNELVVVWRLAEENAYFYQFSKDNGASWSQPQRLPDVIAKPWEHFGLDAYDTATDSVGNVHLLVLGYHFSANEDMGLWHLIWDGSAWSEPNRIFASSDPPEWPRIDIGAGNQVYATWFTRDEAHIKDSERGRYKVWASSYQAAAPALPAVLPTSTPSGISPTARLTATPPGTTPTPTVDLGASGLPTGLYTENDEIGRLLLALAPLIVMVTVLAIVRLGWLRRRK